MDERTNLYLTVNSESALAHIRVSFTFFPRFAFASGKFVAYNVGGRWNGVQNSYTHAKRNNSCMSVLCQIQV